MNATWIPMTMGLMLWACSTPYTTVDADDNQASPPATEETPPPIATAGPSMGTTTPSASMESVVLSFLNADDWNYERVNTNLYRMRFTGKSGTWIVLAQIKPENEQVVFYSVIPQAQNIPDHRRHAAAEYLTRANYGMLVGNFEMDFNDGEVRYKTLIDVEGGSLQAKQVKTLLYLNVLTFDKYLPGLQAVVAEAQTPATAVKAVEN